MVLTTQTTVCLTPQWTSTLRKESGMSTCIGWTALLTGYLSPLSSRTGGSYPHLIVCVHVSPIGGFKFKKLE